LCVSRDAQGISAGSGGRAFDRAIAASSNNLARLAREAIAEHRAGGRHSVIADLLLHPLTNRFAFDQANGAAVGGLGD
jgi:hypothetical protein